MLRNLTSILVIRPGPPASAQRAFGHRQREVELASIGRAGAVGNNYGNTAVGADVLSAVVGWTTISRLVLLRLMNVGAPSSLYVYG